MPRLSVDLDVVYVDHVARRADALAEIARILADVKRRLGRRGLAVELAASADGDETKLFVARGRDRVKIEVNQVFRGTLRPTTLRPLVKAAADRFETPAQAPTLAAEELYGGKLVAAMDRQHPRDWFDVLGMFQHGGLTPQIVECFVSYLAGHNRPVHEVLGSADLDLRVPFENEFEGLTAEPVSLKDLETARARLRSELLAALTPAHRRFLLSLVAGEPDWQLMACPHLAQLPALRWKLQNLLKLKASRPAKFAEQSDALRRCLGV